MKELIHMVLICLLNISFILILKTKKKGRGAVIRVPFQSFLCSIGSFYRTKETLELSPDYKESDPPSLRWPHRNYFRRMRQTAFSQSSRSLDSVGRENLQSPVKNPIIVLYDSYDLVFHPFNMSALLSGPHSCPSLVTTNSCHCSYSCFQNRPFLPFCKRFPFLEPNLFPSVAASSPRLHINCA